MRKLGRWTEALQNIDSALRLNPSHAKAKVNKAICLAELSKIEGDLHKRKQNLTEAHQLLQAAVYHPELSQEVEPILQKVEMLLEYYR